MTSILIDDDLMLRSFNPEDALELFRAVDSSRAHLSPWFNWVDATTKPEHSLHFIQSAITSQNKGEGLVLGIYLQKERKLIGTIGLHNWNQAQKRAQVGYWITPEYEGKGLMYRIAFRFIDFLFQKMELNKIEMHIMPENKRSLLLAEKLGAVTEGRIRESYLLRNKLEDVIVVGILKQEWADSQHTSAK